MKMPVVFVTILLLSLIYLVVTDLIVGFTFPEAVRTLVQSLAVVTVQEKFIIIVVFLVPFFIPIVRSIWKRKKAASG
ncbi:hypothetical protein [Paenibacillus harenae]|uniref:hypothetical protein n=1 Tax=Paenibacillus harenae TaxID=306543 RepID=UPI0003F7B6B1|nr:hypothetical protein [Paenibacillus harenae]